MHLKIQRSNVDISVTAIGLINTWGHRVNLITLVANTSCGFNDATVFTFNPECIRSLAHMYTWDTSVSIQCSNIVPPAGPYDFSQRNG